MELKQLRHFLAIVEAGSFHKAALKVNVTQQAISRSIQRLEKECGGQLIRRRKGDRGTVGPTPFGELLMPRARRALAELRGFRDELENLMGTSVDLVRLGAAPTAARALLPTAIGAFRARRPQARIQVMCQATHVVLDQLASGLYDIAVCDEPDEKLDPQFVGEPLYRDHNVFVARTGHPLSRSRRLALSDMNGAQWVIIGPFCRLWNELRDLHTGQGLTVGKHQLATNSVDLALRHVLNDDFVSYLPAQLVGAELARGELVRLPVRQPKARSWNCLLVRRADTTLNVATGLFVEALRAAARRLPRA